MEPDTGNLAKAIRMFQHVTSLIRPQARFHVAPHRLSQLRIRSDVDRKTGHRFRPILPRRKRDSALAVAGPKNDAERRGPAARRRPPFPKPGITGLLALSLLRILDPKQLEHGIPKEETPVGGTLSRVPVRRSFS